jgi:DNA-directed RNA polymerase specialized sigma24 family protein
MQNDLALLAQLQLKDEKAIYEVYQSFYPSVEKFIVMNNGSEQDAEDVFQDAVMVLLESVSREGFVLTCAVKTFLFAIAKRLWMKQLRFRARKEVMIEIDLAQEDFLTDCEEVERMERKYNSVPEALKRISTHCSGLLKQLFLTGKIPDHYKNDHTLRNQKYKCLQQARKMVEKLNESYG